jgi:hypothetical protein
MSELLKQDYIVLLESIGLVWEDELTVKIDLEERLRGQERILRGLGIGEAEIQKRLLESRNRPHIATIERAMWDSEHWIGPMFEEVRAAAQNEGATLPLAVFAGIFPTGSFNAQAVRCKEGALLLINTGLMMLIWQSLKIIFMRFSIFDNEAGEIVQTPALSHEETIFWITDVILAYLFRGNSTFSSILPIQDGHRARVLNQLVHQTEVFVLAHEYAHAVAGHLSESPVRKTMLPDGEVELVQKSWMQEFEADLIGFTFLLNPKTISNPIPREEYQNLSPKLACPFLFFALDELVSAVYHHVTGLAAIPNALSNHPPTSDRIGVLRAAIDNIGLTPVMGLTDGLISLIESMQSEICTCAENVLRPKGNE